MVYVFALSACGGHDGGIGNGGAVVTAYGAGEAGGHADDGQLAACGEYIKHDGDEDAEGTPGGAGGECDEACYNEDDCGQEVVQGACVCQCCLDEGIGTQQTGDVLETGSHGQNEYGGHHCEEALGDALHCVGELDEPAADHVDDGDDECCQTAHGQTDGRIGIGKGVYEAVVSCGGGIIEAAYVDEGEYGEHDEGQNGNDQIQYAAAAAVYCLGLFGDYIAAEGEQIAVCCVQLMLLHGAEIELHESDQDDEGQGQQGIEIVGDGPAEQCEGRDLCAGGIGNTAGIIGNRSCPGRNGGDHADGCGGRVDDIGKLCAADLVCIGNGTHYGTYGEAVEIVIDEDKDAQQEGAEDSTGLALDVSLGPAAECGGTTGLVDKSDHDAENNEEYEDARSTGNGGDEAFLYYGIHGSDDIELVIEQCAGQNTYKQRTVNFLGDQCQHDGDKRGYQ